MNINVLRQFARQLYIDGVLDLRAVKKLIKEHAPVNELDKDYFELLGHVIDTVKIARDTNAKSKRAELKHLMEKALLERANTY